MKKMKKVLALLTAGALMFGCMFTSCSNGSGGNESGGSSSTTEEKSGYIVNQDKDFLYVACGDKKVLKIKELQVSGKTRTQVKNFLSNGKNYIGKVLGEINE